MLWEKAIVVLQSRIAPHPSMLFLLLITTRLLAGGGPPYGRLGCLEEKWGDRLGNLLLAGLVRMEPIHIVFLANHLEEAQE